MQSRVCTQILVSFSSFPPLLISSRLTLFLGEQTLFSVSHRCWNQAVDEKRSQVNTAFLNLLAVEAFSQFTIAVHDHSGRCLLFTQAGSALRLLCRVLWLLEALLTPLGAILQVLGTLSCFCSQEEAMGLEDSGDAAVNHNPQGSLAKLSLRQLLREL